MESAEGGSKTRIGKSKAPPRLPKPDRTSYEARVAEIQALCDASQSRIDAIKVRIEAKRSGKRIGDGNALPSKSKLQDVRDQFKSVLVRA